MMKPLDLIMSLGALLRPEGHYRCERQYGTGPIVCLYTHNLRGDVYVAASGTSPSVVEEDLASQMCAKALHVARLLRASPEHDDHAEAAALYAIMQAYEHDLLMQEAG